MTHPHIFICRRLPQIGMDMLLPNTQATVWPDELPAPRAELLAQVRQAEGIVSLLTDRIDAEVMDAAPRLRVIANVAVGYDNIDVPAASARGIAVTNTPGVLTESSADCAFALLMAAARRIPEGRDYARAGLWKTWGLNLLLGQDVHGATLGIAGFGRIGQAVARRARGFDMRILYTSRTRNPAMEQELGAEYVDKATLLRQSDFLSVHTPLTTETRGYISAAELAQMKPSAILINTARGPVVDSMALHDALKAGRIFGAALDVTDPEPLPAGHPLYALDNCLIVPHVASGTVATRNRMAEIAATNLLAVLNRQRPPNCVNPEVLRI